MFLQLKIQLTITGWDNKFVSHINEIHQVIYTRNPYQDFFRISHYELDGIVPDFNGCPSPVSAIGMDDSDEFNMKSKKGIQRLKLTQYSRELPQLRISFSVDAYLVSLLFLLVSLWVAVITKHLAIGEEKQFGNIGDGRGFQMQMWLVLFGSGVDEIPLCRAPRQKVPVGLSDATERENKSPPPPGTMNQDAACTKPGIQTLLG
ncbi:hypothetical protein JTE90_014465 [Oedothorax gibbosus]|uniref:Uncharacterized protein n=1 Tax=Oedothorax gibbosus TaxID=931172 RepID=A0AAV6VJE3_9ARAC|nr:hypothetical protein JTE90_014465 [Oedothorax gibbosus]